ncbi:fluoride efflux transporter CrcB [Cupriavidus necator]|uniref:Fluoride-specific ion channel FluC n=2 Tax=Cupriavidus necator (strain ATCC 17699 / DSM 428 / KCTC 22496 / NCIMB 10442 / H16 / Stanier 337) TaxID=381666 RepID=FLUC_CUPNH|nr:MULTISPECIES: fluoride efflux transporter CrcB [Cupriavidus]Q8VM97.1 RecName: Full=Fluoride-specific ion channel FluC [Cupriavidus necator H16]EON20141.1 chromosome condensation membrane protein [Cupriavidus sp. GA3-3]KUE87133.1 camphor resistance protein CrcB [Cupriavidus necator]QCC01161.1 fluoride efflux transporter CrcB [Cupriavidus necator H16]QQB76013.1 fluoride efflux transporter CrcB [Cupriavidus necator]WKA39544.1 fluoride efflux transporter CrcB [Cupriavidus necator]
MGPLGFVAVGVGAAAGAWLRWGFAVLWNAINPALPYGTLAANLLGGYLVGLAVGFFDTHAGLPPEWRLLAITGFLGGLTTFSTFSSEVVANLIAGDYGWAGLHLLLHLGGSLLLTAFGLWTYRLLA